MSAKPDASERDTVLSSFMEACPSPKPAQIDEWCMRFPRFAEEIGDLAVGLLLLTDEKSTDSFAEPTEAELELEYQNSVAALRRIEHRLSAEKRTLQNSHNLPDTDRNESRNHGSNRSESLWQATFGSRLKAVREAKSLDLDALAKAVSPHTKSNWVRISRQIKVSPTSRRSDH